jgi:hypothetical protein
MRDRYYSGDEEIIKKEFSIEGEHCLVKLSLDNEAMKPYLIIFTKKKIVLIPAGYAMFSVEYFPDEMETFKYQRLNKTKITLINDK